MIVIFNYELKGKSDVAHQIGNFSQEMTQIGNACAYIPKAGKADALISLLQQHKIRFGLHQSSGQVRKEMPTA